jgi:hypothetical protein
LCQLLAANEKNQKMANGFNIAAIVTGFGSLLAFGWGGCASVRAMPW